MGIFELPEGYAEIKRVNFQKNKKLALFLNVGAAVILIAFFFIGVQFVPFSFSIDAENLTSALLNLIKVLLHLFGMLLSIFLYITAHELVHGIYIKKYSGQKAKYGFTGMYAYAGSDAYFNKRQYIVIALAPVVLFGLAFFLLMLLLPQEWFWHIYLLQMMNLSGAVGDLYITGLICRLPSDVLTTDKGVEMAMYSRVE